MFTEEHLEIFIKILSPRAGAATAPSLVKHTTTGVLVVDRARNRGFSFCLFTGHPHDSSMRSFIGICVGNSETGDLIRITVLSETSRLVTFKRIFNSL